MRAMCRASPAYNKFKDDLEKVNVDVQEYSVQLESHQDEQRDGRRDLYLLKCYPMERKKRSAGLH